MSASNKTTRRHSRNAECPGTCLGLLAVIALPWTALQASPKDAWIPEKPAVVVETDIGGDRDDQASLIRLLLHSNEIDILAILCDRPDANFKDPSAWNPDPVALPTGLDLARHHIEAYAQVYPNLRKHDPAYPSPEELLAKLHPAYPGEDAGVDALERILEAVPQGRRIWYTNWGSNTPDGDGSAGINASALQRLLDRARKRGGDAEVERYLNRLNQATLDGNTSRNGELLPRSGHLEAIRRTGSLHIETGWPAQERRRWYHRFQPITAKAGDFRLEEDVSDAHGPLAYLYRRAGQKEGDSWSTLLFLGLGAGFPEKPAWGGPAGRYTPRASGPVEAWGHPFYWAEELDLWQGSLSRENSALRFAEAVQNAFRSRWDWCVGSFEETNHDPVPTVTADGQGHSLRGYLRIECTSGSTLRLEASVFDPDAGDTHRYRWEPYPEAGTIGAELQLDANDTPVVTVRPLSGRPRAELHLLLAVTDDGSRKGNRVPDLTRYCRIVFDVRGEEAEDNSSTEASTD